MVSLPLMVEAQSISEWQALSLWDGKWPPFAAEIRLELWKVTEAHHGDMALGAVRDSDPFRNHGGH